MTENDVFHGLFLEKWAEIKEPIRPTESELQFYEKYVNEISELENPEMLILGATPEFRDLALKYGVKSICADLGKPIWKAMKHFMTERGEEELLNCDWLKLPENKKYDLILGDGPINMLSKELGDPFFESVAKVVKDDGVFIHRIMTYNENLRLEDFEKAMEDYRRMNFDINLYGYTVLITNNIREAEYPHLNQVELFDQVLSKYLSKEEWHELRPFLAPLKIYIPTKNDLRAMVDKHLVIEQVREYDGVGYWNMTAQYVFKKKAH